MQFLVLNHVWVTKAFLHQFLGLEVVDHVAVKKIEGFGYPVFIVGIKKYVIDLSKEFFMLPIQNVNACLKAYIPQHVALLSAR